MHEYVWVKRGEVVCLVWSDLTLEEMQTKYSSGFVYPIEHPGMAPLIGRYMRRL